MDNNYDSTAYELGMLKGFIKFLPVQSIPGVQFESGADRLKFAEYLERELDRIKAEANRFSREGFGTNT